MIEFKYRPDIDGLRAIAVLLVVLFHAGFGFSGGYVGVDVFFVISGFLITGLILKEQKSGTFALLGFWERRIRRIVPAAACLIGACLVAGLVLLLPSDLEDLGKSAIAQQLMVANVHFWQNTGYFDGPAELKPLLHTWSLAVEEQFYLILPFLLVLCRRFKERRLLLLLGSLAVISFVASEWISHTHPSAAFFLLPMRAWELLIGSILVLCPPPVRLTPRQRDAMGWLGLAGILLAAWSYNSSTRFPGATALLPCLGTALLIYSNSAGATRVGRVLSNRTLVALGLISYSLYLWHWPVLAFQRYWFTGTVPVVPRISAVLVSVLLAYFSWRFVETPFRRGIRFQNRKSVFHLAVSCSGLLLAVALWLDLSNGVPGRLPKDAASYAENSSLPTGYEIDTDQARKGQLPGLGATNSDDSQIDFLIWGDSHVLPIVQLCEMLAQQHDLKGLIASRSATPPLLGVWHANRGRSVADWNEAVLQLIRSKKIPNVILLSRWAVYVEGRSDGDKDLLLVDDDSAVVGPKDSKAVMQRGLARTIATLQREGVRVWIMAQAPLQANSPATQLVYAAWWGRRLPTGVSLRNHLDRQANVGEVLNSLSSPNVQVLDPTPLCFDSHGNSRIGGAGKSFYHDDDHLSPLGAKTLLRPLFEPVFSEIACRKFPVENTPRTLYVSDDDRDTRDAASRPSAKTSFYAPAL